MKIKVNEIFTSIDGEVNKFGQGMLTTFIRFAGCNLRCSYCDTEYAQSSENAKEMTVKEVIAQVETSKVTITGGEPLMQKEGCQQLICAFLDMGLFVTVETNGSFPVGDAYRYYGKFGWVIDFKVEYHDTKMLFNNFNYAREGDWIKFVVDKVSDYEVALHYIDIFRNQPCRARMAMSTTQRELTHADIVSNLIRDGQWDVSLNVQLHKCINIK